MNNRIVVVLEDTGDKAERYLTGAWAFNTRACSIAKVCNLISRHFKEGDDINCVNETGIGNFDASDISITNDYGKFTRIHVVEEGELGVYIGFDSGARNTFAAPLDRSVDPNEVDAMIEFRTVDKTRCNGLKR
jgi:hypothetical protein